MIKCFKDFHLNLNLKSIIKQKHILVYSEAQSRGGWMPGTEAAAFHSFTQGRHC